ncbi:hypothetical protein Nepgr_021241 [Nepenthes gracilis]|uniref:Retrotransposon gag domain-containing protein n=1 Tax=Nepenthes gracilis TaxID=150966 RepID=A0AAD3SWX2_NEPGR|nr:hypothetical protein Nepgr_021241 [Nepenthes gracilis]
MLATPLEKLLTPTRTMLLMSWSTGPQAKFHRLTFDNWWSRCRPTIAYSNCFVRRKNNNNKWLHQPSFPLLQPKKANRTLREYVSDREPGKEESSIFSGQSAATVQNESRGVRSTRRQRPGHCRQPGGNKTELRNFLGSRDRQTPLVRPTVDQIGTTCSRNDERAIDLDRSPFIAEILSRPLPSKFKMPSLDLYDGGSDPVDHLDHFRTHLSLQGLEDSVMCRCFPLTLKGDARIWFHHLPSGSVSNFRELTDLFLAQYASSRREEKQPWHLSHIKQKPGENPRRFLDRFVVEARRIPRITEEMKLGSFISTLTYRDFFKHLAHKNPQTFREVETITRAYAAAE